MRAVQLQLVNKAVETVLVTVVDGAKRGAGEARTIRRIEREIDMARRETVLAALHDAQSSACREDGDGVRGDAAHAEGAAGRCDELRRLAASAIVLTCVEAKGLEFHTVFLFDAREPARTHAGGRGTQRAPPATRRTPHRACAAT